MGWLMCVTHQTHELGEVEGDGDVDGAGDVDDGAAIAAVVGQQVADQAALRPHIGPPTHA